MKLQALFALVGLATGLTMPALAQQKDMVDPPTVRQRDLLGIADALAEFGDLNRKLDEALNKNDAGAMAALFTEDAVLVAPDGIFYGRQGIEKRYADTFQRCPIITFTGERYKLNAIDHAVWSAGQWWSTVQSQTAPVFAWGYWSGIYVREGDAWKIRMLSLSEHHDPPPPAKTK